MSKQHRTQAVVASSPASRRLKRSALTLSAAVAAIALCSPAHAQVAPNALPTGGNVVAGSATIGTPTPTAMTVNQSSDRAVINWNSFDIGSGASVAFNQPSSTSITVNRVVSGAAPSEIAGTMTANGMVMVLNPNGVLFSGTANVNVGGLIASTGDIDQAAFMAGGGMLDINGANGGEIVISGGQISIADAGLAAFVAPTVRNSGVITATGGRVQLGAGTAFTLDLAGDGLLQIGLGANNPLVQNHGVIFAEGGKVQISARQAAAYVNDLIPTGIVEVGGAVIEGDTIVLQAAGGDVNVGSNTSATGAVSVSGNRIYGAGDLDVTGALTLDVNQGAIANTSAANWINEALGVIGNVSGGTTVNLGAGLYRSGVRVDASNVTIDGHGVAEIGWTSGIENAVDIWGDSVTVKNLEISGPATSGYTSFAWGSTNSRGIFVNRFADNVSLLNNDIHGVRTGIIVDGRNLGTVVTGNAIDNTKSAISVQYTDGSNITLAGNSEGSFGNEWGINVHLNGILQPDGVTINPSTSSASGVPVGVLGTAGLTEQARLLALSDANGDLAVQNLAYSAANRTRAYVKVGGATNTQGSQLSALGTVQAGVDAVVSGGTVHVDAGTYVGNVSIAKSGVSLLSTAGRDATTIQGISGVGASGTLVIAPGANDVTVGGTGRGFTIVGIDNGNPAIENAAVYLRGNHSGVTIQGNRITANGEHGLMSEAAATLTGLTVDGNIFDGKAYVGAAPSSAPFSQQFTTANVSRQLVVLGGGNGGGNSSNISFTNNSVVGDSGLNTAVTIDAHGATISGNSFATTTGGFGSVLRARGTSTIVTGNILDGTNVGAGANLLYLRDTVFGPGQANFAGVIDSNSFNGGVWTDSGQNGFRTLFRGIATAVAAATAGDTVHMLDGTYNLGTAQLKIDKSIALIGESEAGVVIDGRAVSANGLGTISVLADNVSLSNFTLYGSEVALGNYGIKVQPNPAGHVNTPGGGSERVHNFAISDVTVRGSRRAELDLNGVVGATVTNFTADGRRVADGIATDGAGIQIADSADVTLVGVHTLGNNWGGVALYQSNKASGYDAQTTNITIDASLNQFDEANGLFSQLESTTQGFGTLNLTGFDYAVRNTGHRPDGSQFTFFRTDLADATGFALALGAPTSSIEGYAGDHFSNVFTVADGLTIGAAMRDVRAGGTVNVGAGIFNEAVSITKSLTLAGAGLDTTSITGGIAITSGFAGLTLRDFAVSGSASGTSVITNSGTLTNLTVDGVRIDGGNVANRHGFIGGQIGGDIAITGSEFVNIRGWAAFDTRSGASGNDGAQIGSALFTNNLIDNTIGHIAFRQQIGAATLPDITFSGNTVTNVGNATNSFGAIFKAFNADTVDFTGNSVSDVGTSGFNPAGEASYGAVLMTRGVGTLNVTGNAFTDNNQVLAIEPGRGLPTVTNVAGNSFTNNAYSIYLPTNVGGAGTIHFGAGNDFVAGANTVQHIVWRSGAALDLTNVMFDGVLASDMNLAGRFAVADLISDGIDRAGAGLARLVDGELYVTTGSGADAALRVLGLASAGDTVNLSAGTHTLSNTLFVTQNGISVLGQGSGVTTLNASGHNSYGIRVHGDDVTLGGFALLGSSAAVGNSNYGIKVEAGGDAGARNTGFAIRDVAISGTRKTGLDLNAVVGALIDGVSVTGVTNGNGIAITDSANVTVRNTTTSGNAWGGLALYQANNLAGGGSSQQLANITIEASNAFGEANGLYLQDSSASLNPGTLTIGGYDYAVRNVAHRGDGSQFVYFQQNLADATAWALGLGTPSSSSIEGYAGDHYSNVFTVLDGLGIAAAARDVRANGTINVGAGTYASGTMITADGVNLTGAAGAKIDATHNGDNGITINADGVTVQGFEIFGAADQPFNLYGWGSSITRGVVVMNGADNATVTGNTINGVRNGILIDGRNTGAAITGNTIDNTKSAISVQYTDGSNIGISGNSEGANGNEWGIIAHLNGIWNGTAITASAGALGAATPLSEQQRLLDLSGANGGMAVYNQAWSAANRTRAYVTTAGTVGGQGSLLTPASLQAGLDGVVTGGTVHIAAGSYDENVVLNGFRVLDMGAITVNGLTLGTGAAGTVIGTSITASGAINLASGIVLGGDTTLTGGSVTLGAISSPYALTLNGGALVIGAAELASLTATGASITTAGVVTTGAQSYTGATTFAGAYSTGGAAFVVDGAATLTGDTSLSTGGGSAGFGTLTGAHGLVVDAGSGHVAFGAADGLVSLSATGAAIATAGAQTSGNQDYTGATSLSGAYGTAGGNFTIDGATTLAGTTALDTQGGNAALGTVGGAQALVIDAGAGNVALGTVSGLASLSATGAVIGTAGVGTTGAQSYNGATSLAGSYTTEGGALTVLGTTVLGADTSVVTNGGGAAFGAVTGGGNALAVDAGSGVVALGTASGLASLTATGGTIHSSGVTSTGAQAYTGATSLNGSYTTGGGAFTVNGATTTANAVSVSTAGGNASFGTIGGSGGLTVDAAAGNVALGTVDGIASLTAIGATIVTGGAATAGAQSYTGATTLNGAYSAGGDFTIEGAAMLGGATAVATNGGNASFGTVAGANSLDIDVGTGNVALGAANGPTSLTVAGAAIVTAGASTSGAQSYTGATALNGAYATGGSAFTVAGAATLGGTTTVSTGNGAITLGTVSGTTAGGQALTLNAGTGSATLGALGTQNRLGAVSVNAGQTVLGGATYAANSLSFAGGANATVRLTQGTTTFNTTLPGGAGGAITIQPNLIGTVNGQQNVTFTAGNGLTLNSGDVAIGNVGSDAIRLGTMTVNANDFSAQTVKLASTFTSLLSGSQLFSANTLDTLGNVVAQVAGIESGPIRAGGSVEIDAGGSGTGSIIAGGPVSLGYTSDVARAITSTGAVAVSTTGSIGGSINSGGGVSLATTTGAISSTVAATGLVSASTTSGAISSAITSTGGVTLGTTTGAISSTVQAAGPVSATTTGGAIGGTINSTGAVTLGTTSGTIASTVQATGPVSATATSGSITAAITSNAGVSVGSTSGTVGGSIQAGGAVSVNAGGAISAAVTTSGSASLTSANGGVSSTVNAGGPVAVMAQGPVTSTITSGGAVGVTSNSPVSVQVNGGAVTVNAPGGTVTGVFSEIVTDSRGTFVINDEPVIGTGTTDARQIIIDRFVAPAGGTVRTDGTFQLPIGLALGLIAPAGDGSGVQRPPVAVNNVQRLGELLRLGYTAIIIQIDDTNLDLEEELVGAAQ
jgi:filamentous hemagglutinin family protein